MTQIDFTRYPLRTCYSVHDCAVCDDRIGLGQRYYDGGYGRRAHTHCVGIAAPEPAVLVTKLVVIESPLSGDYETNQRYARWCMLDSLSRGEAPFASHLLYTQMLDDQDPSDRELGMRAGFAWARVNGVERVYYTDLGLSGGMSEAWSIQPGEMRQLAVCAPEYWGRFLTGESPKSTRGSQ